MTPEDMQNIVDSLESLLDTVEEDPHEFKEGAAESLRKTLHKFIQPRRESHVFEKSDYYG